MHIAHRIRQAAFACIAFAALSAGTSSTFAAAAGDDARQTYFVLEYATPSPGQDAAYDTWRREKHAPAMLHAPGVASAQFYALADVQNRPRQKGVDASIPQPAKFLTVYTLKTTNVDKSIAAMRRVKSEGASTTASYDWVFRAITPVVAGTAPANKETRKQD